MGIEHGFVPPIENGPSDIQTSSAAELNSEQLFQVQEEIQQAEQQSQWDPQTGFTAEEWEAVSARIKRQNAKDTPGSLSSPEGNKLIPGLEVVVNKMLDQQGVPPKK